MRTITVDHNQQELTPHGTPTFPVEINHDDLSSFADSHIRCHWHQELEISIVCHGQAVYQLGSGTYTLGKGQGIFVNARVPHTVLPAPDEPAILTTFIIHPSFMYGMEDSSIATEPFHPLMSSRDHAAIPLSPEIVALFLQIDRLYQLKPFGYQLKIKGLFCDAFFALLTSRKEELRCLSIVRESDLANLEQILTLLHENFAEPLNLGLISDELAMSKESCCRFFKRMTGQTLSQYLENYRISQSLPLLLDGSLPVTQVAVQVGFSNPGRFSAAFVKRMHCTPRRYSRK